MQAIAFFAVIAVAAAAVVQHSVGSDAVAETLKSDSSVLPDSFNYAYETSNGIKGNYECMDNILWNEQILIRLILHKFSGAANEAGQLRQIGEEAGIVTQGK